MTPKNEKPAKVAYPGDPDGFAAQQQDQAENSDQPKGLDEDAAVKKIESINSPDAVFGEQPTQYGDGEDGFGAVPAQYGNPDEVEKKSE